MIKRFVIMVMLLACSSLSHPSAATAKFSMVAERATRNYQEESLIVQGCTGAVKHREVRELPRRIFQTPLEFRST